MRKISMMIAAALCAVVFAGCASMEVSTKTQFKNEKISYSGTPVAHINATNFGLYFLWWPIMTGSTETPGDVTFFKDTVSVASVMKMTSAKAKSFGATSLTDVVSRFSDRGILFGIYTVQVSANAVK